ncbi:hypothetical protein PFNF54_01331 [Plasmodium falciparum NF54]|uniref:Uncharacterized protein n=1 Tax=Plasmodium falciparum (isolate NF54) TaxID=5843 RepID=W7KJP8_PLAFO|nr:hypothetical protein PFNF54_01331 [Plasmodium falciparum NF54]
MHIFSIKKPFDIYFPEYREVIKRSSFYIYRSFFFLFGKKMKYRTFFDISNEKKKLRKFKHIY